MPNPDAPPLTRGVVLRGLVFGIAIALGAVAVWLIVIADSTKSMRIGVLAGIWGALLGAYSMFGARRHGPELDETVQAQSVSDVPVMSGKELVVRAPSDVERIAEAAARRVFEDRLEQMMRRELSREVGDLRGEIARLRQDLLDKVGGQLRLERIETTRVIGSDLEALQHEVRQLKQASETGTLHEFGIGGPQRLVVEPAKVRPVHPPAAEAAADVKPAPASSEPLASANGVSANGASANGASGRPQAPRTAAPAPAETTGPIRLPQPASAPPHAPAAKTQPPAAAEPAATEPAAPPTRSTPADPFASLPRITPFTEFALDPVDTTPAADRTQAPDASRPAPATASPAASPSAVYTGRRRRTDGEAPDAGRHSRHGAPEPAVAGGGRRRRAADDDSDDDDLLSRLLARGTADH